RSPISARSAKSMAARFVGRRYSRITRRMSVSSMTTFVLDISPRSYTFVHLKVYMPGQVDRRRHDRPVVRIAHLDLELDIRKERHQDNQDLRDIALCIR